MTDGTLSLLELSRASFVLDRLWRLLIPWLNTPNENKRVRHEPGFFEESEILALPTPLDRELSDAQTVALVDDADFHRVDTVAQASLDYMTSARTRVLEGVDGRSDGWYSLVSAQLARLIRQRVAGGMYESSRGDKGIGAHVDSWDGVIVQLRGSKGWRLGEDRSELVTSTGDVLLLPEGVLHDVFTPSYSVHVLFSLISSEPLSVEPSDT